MQIKEVSLTQKPVLPLSDAAASAIESIHPVSKTASVMWPATASGFVYMR
jgi:hypothetical protein